MLGINDNANNKLSFKQYDNQSNHINPNINNVVIKRGSFTDVHHTDRSLSDLIKKSSNFNNESSNSINKLSDTHSSTNDDKIGQNDDLIKPQKSFSNKIKVWLNKVVDFIDKHEKVQLAIGMTLMLPVIVGVPLLITYLFFPHLLLLAASLIVIIPIMLFVVAASKNGSLMLSGL